MDETTAPEDVKRLERSRDDRMVAGVCGGLARYFDLNPAFYRVGFVVLTLLGGAGILIYAAAALVIPDEGRAESVASAALRNRDERPWPVIGLGLVGIALVVLVSRATLWPEGDVAWVLVLVAGAAILWASRSSGVATAVPVPAARRKHRLLRAIAITLAVALAAVIAAGAIAFATLDVSLSDGVGDRTYRITTSDALDRTYELGIGDLDIDLGGVDDLPPGKTLVRARIGVGDVRVVVPPDVALRYRAQVEWGDVEVLEEHAKGHNSALTGEDGDGDRVLVVDAEGAAGKITIERAVR
jgi:phage shock protein PspC (stress-responsive transcriptional regulator)